MLKLTDREWRAFKLEELFEIKGSKTTHISIIKNLKEGKYPYITTQTNNNGQAKYTKLYTENGNILVIDSAVVGFCTYQKNNFSASDHVEKLIPKFNINKYIALFLTTQINNNNSKKFSYAFKASQTRLKDTVIFLPITELLQPDYKFMEAYMREKEESLKSQYKEFLSSRIKKTCKKPQEPKEWKEFEIENIFTSIKRGKRLIKDNQLKGNVPYISSSSLNNGIDNFINNKESVRKYSYCLSLANSGSVGTCFYEPFEFIASDHITHLKGNLSKYQYLFLINSIQQIKIKYNFNREINDNRIKKEKIMLPITQSGLPDYQYMENYMKYLEQQKLLEYLKFLERN